MNRRGFLGSLTALAVWPFTPKVTPKPFSLIEHDDEGLRFHKNAFALMMEPLTFKAGDILTIEGYGSKIGDVVRVPLPKRFTIMADVTNA